MSEHEKEQVCRNTYEEINPKVEKVGRVQVRTSGKPFRAERHPTTIQLGGAEDDNPVVAGGVILDKLV